MVTSQNLADSTSSVREQPLLQTFRAPYQRRDHYAVKLAESIFVTPLVKSVRLAFNSIKLITFDAAKAGVWKIQGYHNKADAHFLHNYLHVAGIVRDIIFIPSIVKSVFKDLFSKGEPYFDDLPAAQPEKYLSVPYKLHANIYSSRVHGRRGCGVIQPDGIREFAAESDGTLKTVMASHFFKPGIFAINYGEPNVNAFVTEKKADGSVQTVKIDAKSFEREPMSFHPTNGKIQSGVFLIPTNLPPEALERFKAAAEKLQGTANITCVNTTCRVLKKAGFSIEGKNLENVVFPSTMFEHFLFRNVFYTDSNGMKHKVRFDIINTTNETLEKHFEKVDMAVLSTRFRHMQRNADSAENKELRSKLAKEIIKEEENRLRNSKPEEELASNFERRKMSISKPSWFGNLLSRWVGRHIFIEVDFSDKKTQFAKAFKNLPKLTPFPQKKLDAVSWIKKYLLFSQTMINIIRRHIMGSSDDLFLNTKDLLNYLKSTGGARLNYAVMDGKVVLAKVNANNDTDSKLRNTADWIESKHAMLTKRSKEVYVSGELWYDTDHHKFMINSNSGTYQPSEEHVIAAAKLANEIFKTRKEQGNLFEAAPAA